MIAAVTVFSLAAAASWASAQQAAQAPAPTPAPASPALTAITAMSAPAKPAPAKPALPAADKSLWKNLTPPQQLALAPLAAEWDKMDAARKLKWLEIANRFASIKPDEQQRVHDKMREWIKLTPEERRKVRENYTATKKIDKDQKSVQWEQYQQLTDEQKKQLTTAAKKKTTVKTPVTNLPAKNQSTVKPVAPVKSGKAAPTVVCPAGTIVNPAAAVPACVKAPEPVPAEMPVQAPAPAPAPAVIPGASNVAPAPVPPATPPVHPPASVPNAK